MKKRSLLFILTVLTTLVSLQAQVVDEQQAKQYASQFFQQMDAVSPQTSGHHAILKRALPKGLNLVSRTSEEPSFYIFNRGTDDGFVIVSGDQRTSHRILGYSPQGTFQTENVPANVQAWLDEYDNEVNVIRKSNAIINQGTGWEEAVGKVVVAPLIATQWDQEEPFNEKCPKRNGERSAVGCIAVAVGQIMNYYQWPQQAKGYVEYEWNSSWIEQDFTQCNYDYNHLDVSQFLYDIAVSCKTDFNSGNSGSSAYEIDMGRALINIFDYDKSMLMHYRKTTWEGSERLIPTWNDEEWDHMLREELDAKRPILYSGVYISGRSETGHEFVCDGYDDAGYFHFNWGWGGYCDGWYVTTSLRPEYSSGTNYNSLQSAFFGLKPNEGGTMRYCTCGKKNYIWGLAEKVNVMYCLENEKTHEKFYGNPNTYDLPANSYGVKYNDIPNEFPQTIPDGTYRKYLVCNEPGTDVYQTIEYGYASDHAEEAETYTWVDVAKGILTESSSRSFRTTDNGIQIDYFTVNDKEVKIKNISVSTNTVTIPAKVSYRDKEYTVTELDFNLRDLRPVYPETIKKIKTSINADLPVELPDGLEELDLYYEGTELTLPSTLKILTLNGFKGTKLTLPSTLERIKGIKAQEVTELIFPASLCQFDEFDPLESNYTALHKLKGLRTVIFEGGCKVKKVPYHCFEGANRLSKVVLHEGLESIGESAFYQCGSLKQLELPKSLKIIGKEAFSGCTNLANITIPDDAQLEEVGEYAFSSCENLEQMTFPASLKVIDNAFYMCGIVHVDLSKTHLEDLNLGFYQCKALQAVILPSTGTLKTITSLGTAATSLVIPQGVERIESMTCDYMKSITLPSSLTYFGSSTLGNGAKVICEATTPPAGLGLTCGMRSGKAYRDIYIYIPAGTASAYSNYRYIPERSHSEYHYFSPLIEMVDTDAPVNVVSDENGITVLGSAEVDDHLVIPSVVQTSEGEVEVSNIADYAFSGNTNLTSIDIPATVGAGAANVSPYIRTRATTATGIGDYAFAYCLYLDTVHVHWNTPLDINETVFEGLDLSALTLVVPDGTTAAYATAPVWKEFGTIVEESAQGIENPKENLSTSSTPFYDLMGRRVNVLRPGNIYLKDGKKILVK